eukprot:TRINITY_DN8621_c0_g1_i1.p1 TRINITY_DN8621_c0_g1~~TRINITY_DN8621_c0_g1_i1.p1  ORF type:complete len:651 (-),score=206.32 TRINITY_DN8621_c0_g1_i1:55-2007(-)
MCIRDRSTGAAERGKMAKKTKAKKQPAAASAEENRLTLEDVAWAGGDDEDLDLIAGIDDSSDDEAIHGGGDQEETDDVRAAVAAFAASMGLGAGAKAKAAVAPKAEKNTAKKAAKQAADGDAKSAVTEFLAKDDWKADRQKKAATKPVTAAPVGNTSTGARAMAQDIFKGEPLVPTGWWKDFEFAPINEAKRKKKASASRAQNDKIREKTQRLAADITSAYDQLVMNKGSADQKYLRSVVRTGTLSDKVAGLSLLVEESVLANTEALKQLTAMACKKSQREAVLALEALKDLYLTKLLPGRPLFFFYEHPVVLSGGQLSEQQLLTCLVEETVKGCYSQLVMALDRGTHDTVEHFRASSTKLVQALLAEQPECEKQLLKSLCNKLGDSSKQLASKALALLRDLVDIHPNMKGVVAREIEDMLHRPHLSPRAQYYAVLFLNQIMLTRGQDAFAQRLIGIYFDTFGRLVARSDADSRILGALLTGVNRAYPYAKMSFETFETHAEALFKMIHISSFSVAVQSLTLLLQVMTSQGQLSDRFFRAVYALLQSPALTTSSKQPLFLNLLYKALKVDTNVVRIQAIIHRLIQTCALSTPTFVCGALYLVSEVRKVHPSLSSMLEDKNKEENYDHCLLYTSDAADEEDSGVLGGRRSI